MATQALFDTTAVQGAARPGNGKTVGSPPEAYWSLYADGVDAVMRSFGQESDALNAAGRAYLDACGTATASMADLSRESLSCRTPEDVLAWQRKAMDEAGEFVSTASRFYGAMLGTYSQAVRPYILTALTRPEIGIRAFAD